MSVSVQEHAILASLQPLFEQAEQNGLWFFHESNEAGEIWCSPEYLRHKQAKGDMVWAPEHWELRNPAGYMKKLHMKAEATVKEFNQMSERLGHDTLLELTPVAQKRTAANES